jgi:alpha-glucosidase (family GH31 glycosyl hydrolase)
MLLQTSTAANAVQVPQATAAQTNQPLSASNPVINSNNPLSSYMGWGKSSPIKSSTALQQATSNAYQNIGNQGQTAYNTGQQMINSAASGQLTPATQQQLNVTTAQITQAQQSATAGIQASYAARGITDPSASADAVAISNSYYEQQKTSAYTSLIQQQETLGLQETQVGTSQQEAGAAGLGTEQQTVNQLYATQSAVSQANEGSFMDLIGGILGGAADIGGAVIKEGGI